MTVAPDASKAFLPGGTPPPPQRRIFLTMQYCTSCKLAYAEPMTDAPPPGRREAKRLATWRALREATVALTDEIGWDAVSIEAVAERADVSTRTVFNYFRSKEALLFDPDPEMDAFLTRVVGSLEPGLTLWEAMERVMLAFVEGNTTKLATMGRLLRDDPEMFHSVMSHSVGLQADLARLLAARLPGDAHLATAHAASAAALGIATVAMTWWEPSTGRDGLAALLATGFAATSRDTNLTIQPVPPTG